MKMIAKACALVEIAPGQILLVSDALGTHVCCTRGGVWITQADDTRDIVLRPGEAFVLDRKGTAVISAPRGATLRMEEAPEAPRAMRTWAERWTALVQHRLPRFQ